MSKLLVTYATNSGSTAEVAEVIAAELEQGSHSVDLRSIDDSGSIVEYDGLVVGAPMIFGWQSSAREFLKRHQTELARKKVAYFACAMRLTRIPGEILPEHLLTLDHRLVSGPIRPDLMNIKNRFTSIGSNLKSMIQAAPQIKPVNVAFFNGKLELFRLKWWQSVFVMLVVRAVPGDYRDWPFIRSWGRSLSCVM